MSYDMRRFAMGQVALAALILALGILNVLFLNAI